MCGQQPTTGPSDIIPPIFFQTLRWHSRFLDGRGHGRHGVGQQNRSQDGLLLRAGGLPDV